MFIKFKKIDFRLVRRTVLDYLIITFGAAVYALALVAFIQPLNIPLGGFSGISLAVNYALGFPIGVVNFILNIPLMLAARRSFGGKFIVRTVFAIAMTSAFTDMFDLYVPKFTGDMLLALFYGGIGIGAGMGIILSRGSTLGGTEIISKYLNRSFGLSMGTSNLILCSLVIGGASFVYNSVESALYAIIVEFLISRVMDIILYGLDESVGIFIITSKPAEISDAVIHTLHRSVTSARAMGMYSMSERYLLICVVRKSEVTAMKRIINDTDSTSFVLFAGLKEVYGNGFKHYE